MKDLNTLMQGNPVTAKIAGVLRDNSLYSGVAVIGGGTALAQAIGIATLPIITRLYDPADLGILAVYSSLLSIVIVAASLRYESAYTIPRQDETAANLFALCLVLLAVTSTVFALVIFLAGDLLAGTFSPGPSGHYLWLLVPGFFGAGLYSILNYWAVRQRDYRRVASTRVNQGASGAACKILLGLLSAGPAGLIVGHIVSQAAGIGTFSRSMWKTERENLKQVSVTGIRSVAKEYWSFPAFNLPASVVNTLSLQLPALMLLAIYGSQTVGLYALAQNLLVLPGSIVSTALAQVYLGEASKLVREDSSDLRSLYVATVRQLALVAVPSIGALALAAPFLTPVVFGGAWVDAGWYCLPLALMMIPQFVAAPTSRLTIYGYNHWTLIWDLTRVCGVIAGFSLSQYFRLSVMATLTVYAAIMLVMYLVNISLNLKAIANFTSRIPRQTE